ncbi:MAG: hypothetical protein ABIN25_14455 [Ginsengibacter sp.]
MEDNFYLDDFELSLKEQANQFKMAPSKKVWHGIYNDMHPGRRWPSITISLLLVLSIVFVGYINSHSDKVLVAANQQNLTKDNIINKEQSGLMNENLSATEVADQFKNNGPASSGKQISDQTLVSVDKVAKRGNNAETANSRDQIKSSGTLGNEASSTLVLDNMEYRPSLRELKNINSSSAEAVSSNSSTGEAESIESNAELSNPLGININADESSTIKGPEKGIFANENLFVNEIKIIPVRIISDSYAGISILADKIETDNNIMLPAQILATNDEELSKKIIKKRNTKTTWLFYAGPSISTVSFSGKQLTQRTGQNSLSLPQVTQKDYQVMRNPMIGFEVGAQMNYSFAKKLQLTAGVHFNRSGYQIISSEVHPILTTLLLKDNASGDQYSRNFVTHFGDGHGQSTINLKNYSYQASLPVGIQYELLGNSKIQFNLALNVEPSLVLKSDAYLMSSDGRNYVNVPDLSRKWNLNSNFTPFISFRSDKFKWNLGPVVRYQWLSSYMDDYTIKEHLINYGIRVGISK